MRMTNKIWVALERYVVSGILEGTAFNILDQLHKWNNWEDANRICHRHKAGKQSSECA